MGTKRTLVEIEHDEGYGDNLLMYLNAAIGTRDMRAVGIHREFEKQIKAEQTVQKILSENVLTLQHAAIEVKNITGRKPDRATLLRWLTKGVHGAKLEACRVGPTWITSQQALQRFIVKQTRVGLYE